MTVSAFLRITTVAILGVNLLLVGCGKKPEEKDGLQEATPLPISTINEFLSKQNISCEKGQICPNYLSKLVVVHGSEYKFCTGFLVSPTVMATSSSCLPSIVRKAGQDCSRDIHFFFPKVGNTPAVQAGCAQVLQASELDGADPILWRDDVTFLELKEPIYNRRKAIFSRQGPGIGKALATWVVDQQDAHSAIIKKLSCEPIYSSYINPLSSGENSPNLVFGDCFLPKSGMGAPVIDSTGRVRAMASRMVDDKLVNYLKGTGLLINGLKKMFHSTNFACANILDDMDMTDERECLKELSYNKVDKLRSDMLSTSPLFKDHQKIFEAYLPTLSKNLNFGVKYVLNGDVQNAILYPSCFKPLKEWVAKYGNKNTLVEDVMLPNVSFRRVMNSDGKIQGITIEKTPQKFLFQISLKNLRAVKRSSVLMWSETTDVESYPGITEVCPQ